MTRPTAWRRRLTAVVALIAAWALLAAPGTVVHAAVNDRDDQVAGAGGVPWSVASAMAAVGAYVFWRYVVVPRGGRDFRGLAVGSIALVAGAFVVGFAVAAIDPANAYAGGLIASAICLAAGALSRA
ncbi:hypothetical protein, partial [Streptodolium elevatio]